MIRTDLKNLKHILLINCMMIIAAGCSTNPDKPKEKTDDKLQLITLDPGHFHSALVQKSMYEDVDSVVHVYAPDGQEVKSHLSLIDSYNTRDENPTAWKEKVYTGPDYLDKMFAEKAGNVVVIAGNNKMKTDYIRRSVESGLNVLADKPMAIDLDGFNMLVKAFESAEKNKVLLYDIMTERYEINSMLQKEFAHLPAFGQLEKGTTENPSVTKVSVHHFFKNVSGKPLVRPAWFFDVKQQGEGITDITTHLVDLVQWECFPDQILDYKKDIEIVSAKRWATSINAEQFEKVTQKKEYPEYLKADVKNGILNSYSNGEINYRLKGIHAKISVTWDFQAPEGTGDTHFSVMWGTNASVVIKQGKEQNFKPALYIEPVAKTDLKAFEKAIMADLKQLNIKYPGVELKKIANGWEVIIPDTYKVSHEDHFAQVTKKYLEYLKKGGLPAWEVPNMIAKYYTTTKAREVALGR
ncbi:Oxidoreductase family, NAD-binding Rossmann fold [Daejeonella rubra]|uniref:Oxidoreductase family, NAD-binding Rossmann fold n=1 Tax=Daejeonella rubra TaxID=990371 RepID=A0A1G9V628_9SPHI|nr:putative oxidoreductase C-terminal domain-containing protein [Daejeonella rubra]SDM67642.1 Oxidoreductase family, NAD-binding Rossmann fold [Daejeonella rubra]